jgi:hypothetical protein
MLRRIVGSMLFMLVAGPAVAGSAVAGAQIGRRPVVSNEPGYWVGLSIGYVDGFTTSDQGTGSTWQIGYTSQLRATLEKTVQRGVSVGVAAGFSTAPLTYSGGAFDVNCPGSCQAHADVTQYVAFLRAGGSGTGFHYLFNLEGGATSFSNFRETTTDMRLQPTSQSYDMTFGFGGGFEYGFSQSADVYVGELTDIILHKQATGETTQAAPHQTTFRAGFRIGF